MYVLCVLCVISQIHTLFSVSLFQSSNTCSVSISHICASCENSHCFCPIGLDVYWSAHKFLIKNENDKMTISTQTTWGIDILHGKYLLHIWTRQKIHCLLCASKVYSITFESTRIESIMDYLYGLLYL